MCRLMVYLGTPCLLADLVTKPSRSLTRQSYDAKERLTGHGYLNGDGFGIGWYPSELCSPGDPTPCMFSSIQPAWNNRNLERLANKIVSPLIFAHVRAAYPGIPVSDANCQPFVCGRYMWMHNGGVGGFHIVRRALLNSLRDDVYGQCPSFESDSAICFALFLNQMDDPMEEKTPLELVSMVEATINQINTICEENGVGEELSLLNFVVSDGTTVVASRYSSLETEAPASLYYASGSQFVCADPKSNQYFVRHSDRRGLLGIVASEPLTDENADWIQVPRNTMVVMTKLKGQFVDLILVPINATPAVARDINRCFKALASGPTPSAPAAGTPPLRRPSSSSRTVGPATRFTGAPLLIRPDSFPLGVPVTSQPRHCMTGHVGAVLTLAVQQDGVFTGGQDGLIKLYDLRDFKCVKTLPGHSHSVFSLTTHHHRLYSSSTRVVKIWDTDTFQLLSTLRHSDGDVFALALAQGRAVAGPAGTSIVRCNRGSSYDHAAAMYLKADGTPHVPLVLHRTSSSPTLPEFNSVPCNGIHPTLSSTASQRSPSSDKANSRTGSDDGSDTDIVGPPVCFSDAYCSDSAEPRRAVARHVNGSQAWHSNGDALRDSSGGRAPDSDATPGRSSAHAVPSCSGVPMVNGWDEPGSRLWAQGVKAHGPVENGQPHALAENGHQGGSGGDLHLHHHHPRKRGGHAPHQQPSQGSRGSPGQGGGGSPRRPPAGSPTGRPPAYQSHHQQKQYQNYRPPGLEALVSNVSNGSAVASSQPICIPNSRTKTGRPSLSSQLAQAGIVDSPKDQGLPPHAHTHSHAHTHAHAIGTGILGSSPCVGPNCWLRGGPPARATEPTLVLTDTDRMGHCSRVYALAMCDPLLCSGAGDGFIKVWNLETGTCIATLYGHKGGVMALAAVTDVGDDAASETTSSGGGSDNEPGEPDGAGGGSSDGGWEVGRSTMKWRLLSGSRDNTIRVWDMGTASCITAITGHTDDVLGLCIGFREEFFSASSDQTVRMWSLVSYECLRIFHCTEGVFLSVACTEEGVLTGSSDGIVRFWDVDTVDTPVGKKALAVAAGRGDVSPGLLPDDDEEQDGAGSKDAFLEKSHVRREHSVMEDLLRSFVALRTVSTDRSKAGQDQGWRGARYLLRLLEDLGAEAKLVSGAENTNPVVLGRLLLDPRFMTVTVCAHYDVQDAEQEGWKSDPFELVAVDGYLYGRGVSDCKGPIIAILGAIKELVAEAALKLNIIFVFDGMNENGCLGFREVVTANLDWFEGTEVILTSKSAWLSDHHPCLTYGMRGMICLLIEVSGPSADLHSGSDGGAFNEPMNDLVTVLSNLVDSNNMILIPGFYDDVKPLGAEEEALYEGLPFKLSEYKAQKGLRGLTAANSKEVLMNRWRNPSLSITGINMSASNWSTISRSCGAKVTIRHVPNQDPAKIVEKVRAHVAHEFAKLRSANQVEVRVVHIGDWWLADHHNRFYRAAEKAIESQWGCKPMYVREGGTLPVVSFMEKALGAPALHLPISQASNHNALQNERLKWTNFIKGKDTVKDLLTYLGTSGSDQTQDTDDAALPS